MSGTFKIILFFTLTSILPALVNGHNRLVLCDFNYEPYDTLFITSPSDSILIKSKDKEIKSKVNGESDSGKFYKKLEEQAEKRSWIQWLHDFIIISPAKPSPSDSLADEKSFMRYPDYVGYEVNQIKLLKLDPFNVSILDTLPKDGNLFTRTANIFHVKTHDRIILKQLLIKPGDILDPQSIADNERLLRDLPFIEDARIIVETLEYKPGFADLIIITKDLWSKVLFPELKDARSGKLEIYDKNLFGSGLEIQNNIHWDPSKSDRWGYEAIYKNPNILGSFINSRFYYINVFETGSYGYSLQRKFFTQDIKYAGGSNAYFLNTIRNIWIPDSGYRAFNIKTNYFDIWSGRSFKIIKESSFSPGSLNLIIASRFIRENYFERPEVTEKTSYSYHNKVLWLNSLALSSQLYLRSNLIYSFGRTEDIPVGYLVNLTLGPEFGEFSKRLYTSISLSRGNYIEDVGYLYSKLSMGGFKTNQGGIEQGLLDLKLTWFSNLFALRNFRFRHFIKFNYLKGYDRFNDDRIYINDPYGLRGFRENNVFGDQKMTLTFESNTFFPGNFIGFNFVGFGFADVAFLGDNNSAILSNDIFTGLGLGFRIRNERLAFPTFLIRFAYYPNLPEMSPSDFIRFLGEDRFRPDNFNVDAPALLNFR